MTPVSSPVNTLVVGPGNYAFGDFVKVGVPFTLVVLVVSVLLVPHAAAAVAEEPAMHPARLQELAMTAEVRALTLSAAAALLLGVLGLAVSLATGSGAILLDGAFNLCFFVTALATLRVARLLQRPDDRDYPFGYLHFEPLINTVKAALILIVALLALIDAGISHLSRGQRCVGRAGAALRGVRHRRLRSAGDRAASRAAPGGEPAGGGRHRELDRQPRDLGRDVRRVLPGAVAAAKRHGAGGAGWSIPCSSASSSSLRSGFRSAWPGAGCWRCSSGHPRRTSSARSRGWCATPSPACRSGRSMSGSSNQGGPPMRWSMCCSTRRCRAHRRTDGRAAPGDRCCGGGPVSASDRRRGLHRRGRIRSTHHGICAEPRGESVECGLAITKRPNSGLAGWALSAARDLGGLFRSGASRLLASTRPTAAWCAWPPGKCR